MKQPGPLQKVLSTQYELLRKRNPSYSIRAFARKVGIAPGTLSLVMLGKRNVSGKMALKIANNLQLGPQERSEILSKYLDEKLAKNSTGGYQEFTADQYSIVSEWQYFAILSLMRTKDFKSDPGWIAERLGLKKSEVKASLEVLERLELIWYNEENELQRSEAKFRTPDEIVSAALKEGNRQSLDLAHQSLDRESITERDFTTITFPMNPEKIPEAKELIRKFEDDLMDLMESDENLSEVYRMGVQLYPLTKLRNKK